MKPTELATALRKLADRVESFDLPADYEFHIDLEVSTVKTREDLAKLVAFAGEGLVVNTSQEHAWLRRYKHQGGFGFCAFYTPGLLGGARKEVVVDSQAGLDALLAECSHAPEETAVVA